MMPWLVTASFARVATCLLTLIAVSCSERLNLGECESTQASWLITTNDRSLLKEFGGKTSSVGLAEICENSFGERRLRVRYSEYDVVSRDAVGSGGRRFIEISSGDSDDVPLMNVVYSAGPEDPFVYFLFNLKSGALIESATTSFWPSIPEIRTRLNNADH